MASRPVAGSLTSWSAKRRFGRRKSEPTAKSGRRA